MSLWWRDPGPCPVDDCPHTTCTSPDYAGGCKPPVAVIPQTPMRDLMVPGWSNNPTPAPAAAAVETAPFTTKTYRRGMLRKRP